MKYILYNKNGKKCATGKDAKQISVALNNRTSKDIDSNVIKYVCATKGEFNLDGYVIKLHDNNILNGDTLKPTNGNINMKYCIIGKSGKRYTGLTRKDAAKKLKCSVGLLTHHKLSGTMPFKHKSFTVYIDGDNPIPTSTIDKTHSKMDKRAVNSNKYDDALYTCITPSGNFFFAQTIAEISEICLIPKSTLTGLFDRFSLPFSFNDYHLFNAKCFNDAIAKKERPKATDIGQLFCTYNNDSGEENLFMTIEELSNIVDINTVELLRTPCGYPVSVGFINVCDFVTYANMEHVFHREEL